MNSGDLAEMFSSHSFFSFWICVENLAFRHMMKCLAILIDLFEAVSFVKVAVCPYQILLSDFSSFLFVFGLHWNVGPSNLWGLCHELRVNFVAKKYKLWFKKIRNNHFLPPWGVMAPHLTAADAVREGEAISDSGAHGRGESLPWCQPSASRNRSCIYKLPNMCLCI